MRLVLDTNFYSNFRLRDDRTLEVLSEATRVYLPIVVMGELLYGFAKGSKEIENNQLLGKFLRLPSTRLLNTTSETASIYTGVKTDLLKQRRRIPENDVWIAAITLEQGARLATFDQHFQDIPGLRLVSG